MTKIIDNLQDALVTCQSALDVIESDIDDKGAVLEPMVRIIAYKCSKAIQDADGKLVIKDNPEAWL